jgi:hypothetical protein
MSAGAPTENPMDRGVGFWRVFGWTGLLLAARLTWLSRFWPLSPTHPVHSRELRSTGRARIGMHPPQMVKSPLSFSACKQSKSLTSERRYGPASTSVVMMRSFCSPHSIDSDYSEQIA